MLKDRSSQLALALCICAGWSHVAQAQDAPAAAPAAQPAANQPEIVVTGSRLRAESVQKTPIAVSVLAPKQLEALQVRAADIRAISGAVPNLLVEPVGSSPGTAAISLRGFNTRTSDIAPEPGVAIYVDGVYQVINTGQMVDMFDLDKIEVLRGPQGTLLGKNAGAGAILLTRSRPTGDFSGRFKAEYGSYNLRQFQGLVNFPIIGDDVLSGKVFASYRKRDGYVKNLVVQGDREAGEDVATVRGALLFKPTSQFDLYLTADYMRDRSDSHPGRNVSGPDTFGCQIFGVCDPHGGLYAVTSATQLDGIKTNDNNITANANWHLGGVKLTSITGYRHFWQDNSVDLDSVPQEIIQVPHELKKLNQFSEEFRVSSVENGGLDLDGRLNWLVAGYFGHSNATGTLPLDVFGSTTTQSQRIKRTSYAVFGHVDFKIIDPWTISAGARRSHDKVDHDYSLRQPGTGPVATPYNQADSWNNTSLEAGTQFQIDRSKMVYFRYAEGYRGGTFVGLPASVEAATVVNPETSKSFELGLKSDWLNHTFQLNVTLFDVKYRNLQRDIVLRGTDNSFIQATANAANASTKGVEIEAIARPARNFTWSFNLGYLKAKYTRYVSLDPVTGVTLDLSGQPLTYAPKFTINTAIDYSMPMHSEPGGFTSLDFHADLSDRSEYQTSASANPIGLQKAFSLVNGSVSLVNRRGFTLSAYVQNAFNQHYMYLGENVSDLIYHEVDAIGRTFGGSVSYKF